MAADSPLARLLDRAAQGDQEAAAEFDALRALLAEAHELSTALARRHAWKLIRRSPRSPS